MPSKYRYGVVLDAGSSGTRIHIYRWLKTAIARAIATPEQLHQLPEIRTKNKKWTAKKHPGLSTFAGKEDLVGPDHLKELLNFAKDVVPQSEISDTPIFLLATAGMRLVDDLPRKAILAEVCKYTRQNSDFHLPDCDEYVQVISGETEGLYGWIAVNYLVGGFDKVEEHTHRRDHHTYGFLDMGGASIQIAFAPNATEAEKHGNDLQLLRLRTLDGAPDEYKVYVTTFLEYGATEARRRYVKNLTTASEGHATLPDPCLPSGLQLTSSGSIVTEDAPEEDKVDAILHGTGKFAECLKATYPLLDKDAQCDDPPCLFHGRHSPALDFSINHFLGVSNFWHGTHEIFEMGHKDRAYDLATYQERVTEFCNSDWDSLSDRLEQHEWGSKVDVESALDVCFKASWIINILHEGIGIPRVGLEASTSPSSDTASDPSIDSGTESHSHNGTKEVLSSAATSSPASDYLLPFQAVNKIDDTEVAWVLGKMVLYASSQIPPLDTYSLDVGFGTNDPLHPQSLPSDFQPGGSQPDIFRPDDGEDLDLNQYLPSSDDDDTDLTIPPSASHPKPTSTSSITSKLHNTLATTAHTTTRKPGYLLLLLILILLAILLCGRERRTNILRKLRLSRDGAGWRSPPTSSTPQMGKRRRKGVLGFADLGFGGLTGAGSGSGGKYERLLEEGGGGAGVGDGAFGATGSSLAEPASFELGSVSGSGSASASASASGSVSNSAHSSSDDDDRNSAASSSRSSGRKEKWRDGRVTPRRVGVSPYLDNGGGGGGGSGGSGGGIYGYTDGNGTGNGQGSNLSVGLGLGLGPPRQTSSRAPSPGPGLRRGKEKEKESVD